MSTRDAYVQKMKARLDEWNAELDKLEAKIAAAQADTRIDYERQLEGLQRQRDEARQKLRELETAGDAAFEDMRRGFESAWKSMNEAFTRALGRFR